MGTKPNKAFLSDKSMSSCLLQNAQKPRQHTFAPDQLRYQVTPLIIIKKPKASFTCRSRVEVYGKHLLCTKKNYCDTTGRYRDCCFVLRYSFYIWRYP